MDGLMDRKRGAQIAVGWLVFYCLMLLASMIWYGSFLNDSI